MPTAAPRTAALSAQVARTHALVRARTYARTLAAAAALGALGACATSPRAAPSAGGSGGPGGSSAGASAASPDGWRSLFDGRTLAGWRGLGATGVPTAHWTVVDGTIKKVASGRVAVQADGQPVAGGDLMTEAAFGDFELAWEWKVTPGANSGLKYNVSEELSTSIAPRNAAKGFEYQVLDDDRHPDGRLVKHRTGDLYDLISANERKRVRPVGEWNESRIVLRGNHGEHWLNGEKVVEYELGSAPMDSALAASKYKPIPWFGQRRRGHIVLQDHGDEVYFRNIRVRELDAARSTTTR